MFAFPALPPAPLAEIVRFLADVVTFCPETRVIPLAALSEPFSVILPGAVTERAAEEPTGAPLTVTAPRLTVLPEEMEVKPLETMEPPMFTEPVPRLKKFGASAVLGNPCVSNEILVPLENPG